MLAKRWGRARAVGRRIAESCRWPRLTHTAQARLIELDDDFIGDNLRIIQRFAPGLHFHAGHVIRLQPRDDVVT